MIRAMGCAAFLAASGSAWAGNRVRVVAVMNGSCTAFAVPINFGTLPPGSFTLTATTILKVDCPASTTVTIAIDNGQNFSGGKRRMVRVGGGAKWLPYELYKDAAGTRRWGSVGAEVVTATVSASGTPLSYTIYGKTSGNVGSGGYQDMVTVTLTY